ncbi:glycosyltransferase family 4 protein [Acidimicrobiia bacterium]|nr:glycosyltransferase family 4 protein [Acidimicrobiia bacterium]
MKKILVIHNRYQYLGGEDIAVDNEINVLKRYFEVETIFFDNDLDNYFFQFFYFIFSNNRKSNSLIRKKIVESNPDLIYVHNTWFKASLGIFKVIEELNIPVILKLHNFRYSCTKSLFSKQHLLGENFCKACGYKKENSIIFNKYFKDSWFKSLLVLIYGRKYFSLIQKKNIKIVVLTNFHKEFIQSIGDFENRVYVHPNPLEIIKKEISTSDNPYITYAGRISEEKGVKELIEAFLEAKLPNIHLKIIGNGPSLEYLKRKYIDKNNIIFYGFLGNVETLNFISTSVAVITATKLHEGQPTLLCEASSLGVPSIFPDSGGIKDFFPAEYPLSYIPFDRNSLVAAIKKVENKDIIKKTSKQSFDHIFTYLEEKKLINNFQEIINV